MEFNQYIESIIKKRMKLSQLLLLVSIVIAVGVGYWGVKSNTNYYIWAIYFLFIGALSLPTINRAKQDLSDFKKNILNQTEGRVLDIFPEKKESGTWMMFVGHENTQKIDEFVFPSKPEIVVESQIRVYHTKILKIPVRIELIENPLTDTHS